MLSHNIFVKMSGYFPVCKVSGATALLFQVNPNLTPQMAKMIMQHTAQTLDGNNILEQGSGQLNVKGAIELARLYKLDIDYGFNPVTFTYSNIGEELLQSGYSFPAASSVVEGSTFSWSQGIFSNHAYLTGQALASKYHAAYDEFQWFAKGVSYSSDRGQALNWFFAPGVALNENVLTSNGNPMGGGTTFLSSGVLLSDGVLFSDGVLMSERIGATSNSVLVNGDATAFMD